MAAKNTRQVRGNKIDTVAVVHEALAIVAEKELDLATADRRLRDLGHMEPAASIVRDYAYQIAVLAQLQIMTTANCSNQIGKWNFRNEATIYAAFNAYLSRRVAGMRSNWSR